MMTATSPAMTEVPVGDRDAMLDAIAARRPILVRGLTTGWDAAGWTFDSLRDRAGDQTVKVLVDLPDTGGVLAGGQESYKRDMPFTEFLDMAARPDLEAPCYLGYVRPAELIPGYEHAFDFGPMTPRSEHPTDTRLWIGSARTCSGLHSDLKDNVFAQIQGRKRVILVPFGQIQHVYPFVHNIVNSMVDPEHLDVTRFPRFLKADVATCVVEPNDVLYIPRGWWHYLRSESPSISINHWFGPQIPSRLFLALLCRLGPRYVGRTLIDLVRYSLLGRRYHKDFFFTPPSTGERLFDLIRHGDFSRDNDPAA
jgi:lysine-specific demethylase 8